MTSPDRLLSDILRGSGVGVLETTGPDPRILGAAVDSRKIEPGHVFFAIRGFEIDGERFVPQAVARGSPAIVAGSARPVGLDSRIAWVRVENPRRSMGLLSREIYGRPDESLRLVGITGTNGKTTVAHLVQSIAAAAGASAGRIGTVGYSLGEGDRPLERTTPESPDLYRLLAKMVEHRVDVVAMEVSSHALALHRVEGTRFAVAAFLNLSRDHLDFHNDEESYFEAKARLFDSLTADQCAVLPADCARGAELRTRVRHARVLTFGRSRTADVRLGEEHSAFEGSSAILETPGGKLPIRTFLLGRFNLDNIAAAAACALALELPPESITAGVLAVTSVPGRMERIDCGQPFAVLVDYAHTPEALASVLRWARSVCGGRLAAVFGCGGDRDKGKRFAMGAAATELADLVVLTSDNPRQEDPVEILRQIREGADAAVGDGNRCRMIADRRQAIRTALSEAAPLDVVLIAGKGHETTQTTGERIEPFDDRVVARQILQELGWAGGRCAEA